MELEIRKGLTWEQAWRREATDLEACNRDESLFTGALESFRSSFDYKVKLVSKLQEIFDNFKYFTDKNEKQLLIDYGTSSLKDSNKISASTDTYTRVYVIDFIWHFICE